jgi:RecA/RadA recombinase
LTPVDVSTLERDIAVIKKRRGDKAIINGNEEPAVSRIPLESPALMRITSGGIPLGRVTRLWSGPSAGKSLLGWEIIRQAQLMGLMTCYWDIEKQYSREFTEMLGVDVDKMKREDAEIIEDIGTELQLLLGSIHVHVLDSCSEAKPAKIHERDLSDPQVVALKIRTWEAAWEYIMSALDKQDNAIISIDHAKSTFAPGAPGGRIAEKPLGGKEIEHHSSLSLQLQKDKWLYYDDDGFLQTEDKLKEKGILGIAGQREADGQEVVVRVAKSRVCQPLRVARLRLDLTTYKFDHTFEYMCGAEYFDKYGNIAHHAKTPAIADSGGVKQGGWVTLPNGDKIQGQKNLRQRISEDKDLQNLIRKAMLAGN